MNELPEAAPCTCTLATFRQCHRAGRPMTLRDFEMCSGTSEVPSRRVNLEMSPQMRWLWDSPEYQARLAAGTAARAAGRPRV